MEKRELYYTPEEEEFYKGFEYEVFQKGEPYNPNWMYLMPPQTEDEWFKYTYPDPFLGNNLKRMLDTYTMRVKHLDQEDIEELGFELLSLYEESLGYTTKAKYDRYQKGSAILTHYYEFGKVSIDVEDKERTPHPNLKYKTTMFFYGKIKNKTELKRILKQLNIGK